jgi:hypothetical protein
MVEFEWAWKVEDGRDCRVLELTMCVKSAIQRAGSSKPRGARADKVTYKNKKDEREINIPRGPSAVGDNDAYSNLGTR